MAERDDKNDNRTKMRLIETAERLFAEKGFSAVSLREITREAGANVAAVNYHFGSKVELITEVENRLTRPVNEARLARLDELEKSGDVKVRSLLQAFIEPLMGKLKGNEMTERLYSQFMARFLTERAHQLQDDLKAQFQEVAQRYVAAFLRVTPWLTSGEIIWRIDFSFGVFTNALLHRDILPQIVDDRSLGFEMEILLEEVLNFCEAGFNSGKK